MIRFTGILIFILSAFLFSCSKSDTTIPLPKLNLPDSSETKASLDSSCFGVYKAVLAGNTGHVKLYFKNGDSIMKAFLTLDSLSDTLTCTQNFITGQPIADAYFEGRISSFYFNADSAGNNASMQNISARAHSEITGVIAHEKTGAPVFCYEALFTGTQKGNFNFIRYGNSIAAVASTTNGFVYKGDSFISGRIFTITMNGLLSTTTSFETGLDLTGDYFSGSWTNSSGGSGVFNGKRTL